MTLSGKLDSQLARAFRDFEERSGLTRSQAMRKLLRAALGIAEKDGIRQEAVMKKIADHNRKVGAAAR